MKLSGKWPINLTLRVERYVSAVVWLINCLQWQYNYYNDLLLFFFLNVVVGPSGSAAEGRAFYCLILYCSIFYWCMINLIGFHFTDVLVQVRWFIHYLWSFPGMCRNMYLTKTLSLFKATGTERGVVMLITNLISPMPGAHGGAVGWDTVLQDEKSRVRLISPVLGAHGGAVGWDTALQPKGRVFDWSAQFRGTRWRSWLRHGATSRKIACSIPDGVVRIFHWHNPSGSTVALGLTQPLTEMSTRNVCGALKPDGA